MKKQLPLLVLLLVLVPSFVLAQQNNVNTYVPPPLFGERKTPSEEEAPRLQKDFTIPQLPKAGTEKPAPTPAVTPAPKPKKKPIKAVKRKTRPAPEPIDLLKRPASKKPSSEGVVKGPKTMPSNKKSKVDAEVTFEAEDQRTPDLLDRVQKKDEEPTAIIKPKKKIQPIVESDSYLSAFDIQPDGEKKITMVYQGSQSDLDAAQKNILMQSVIPALDADAAAKLRIQAYASPQGDAVSTDRRLALSRALAIRSYLLAQEIPARRIDVRALGAQSDIQPLDRVELFVSR